MSTKGLDYIIDYKSLESGTYEVDYHLDKEFFELFPEPLVEDGSVDVHVVFKVSLAALQFHFDIQGTLDVECDRCLEHFDMPIEGSYDMVAKIGDEATPEEENDDFITISSKDSEIDLSKHLYEFVMLSLPPQRVHPDDEDGNSTCNPDMLDRFYVQDTDDDDIDELLEGFDDDDEDFFDDGDDDDLYDEEADADAETEHQDGEDDVFDGMEMETIEQKLAKNPNWEKLKSLLNKDINK
ncbi:MAG: DUF177 domain-containing protein [Bacteroidales bacterium]|nr:DUF177 domain-containing protein [Bacteroidales bacterium]